MKVVEYLRTHGLEKLKEEYNIKVNEHPTLPLVILNYNQINSPKNHPIVDECRALVLEKDTWNVVARAFNRFYNLGEIEDEPFELVGEMEASTKEDGSLILIYNYQNQWIANTRGSFDIDCLASSGMKTWRQIVYEALGITDLQDFLGSPFYTYVFELCSKHNKVVREYSRPTMYLLAVFKDKIEQPYRVTLQETIILGVPAVEKWSTTYTDIFSKLVVKQTEDPTFEGYVLKDHNGRRLKVKSSTYLELHKIKGNTCNIYNPNTIVPIIMRGETDDIISYFPEYREFVSKLELKIKDYYDRAVRRYESCKDIEIRKEFAEAVKDCIVAPVVFKMYENGGDIDAIWSDFTNYIIRLIQKENAIENILKYLGLDVDWVNQQIHGEV